MLHWWAVVCKQLPFGFPGWWCRPWTSCPKVCLWIASLCGHIAIAMWPEANVLWCKRTNHKQNILSIQAAMKTALHPFTLKVQQLSQMWNKLLIITFTYVYLIVELCPGANTPSKAHWANAQSCTLSDHPPSQRAPLHLWAPATPSPWCVSAQKLQGACSTWSWQATQKVQPLAPNLWNSNCCCKQSN